MKKYLYVIVVLILPMCALGGSTSDAADAAVQAALAAATASSASAGSTATAGASNVGGGSNWVPVAYGLAAGVGGYLLSDKLKKSIKKTDRPSRIKKDVSLDLKGYEDVAALLRDFPYSQDPQATLVVSWARNQSSFIWGDRPGQWKSRDLHTSDVKELFKEYRTTQYRYSFMEYFLLRVTKDGDLQFGPSKSGMADDLPHYVKFEFNFMPAQSSGVHQLAGAGDHGPGESPAAAGHLPFGGLGAQSQLRVGTRPQ